MGENHQNNQLYFFSKKVLLFSLLFLSINVLLFGLLFFQQKIFNFNEVAPKIVFAEKSEVLVKTPFDSKFLAAQQGQTILIDSFIKTDDKSYADIRLNGNIVHMDSNTEVQLVENNFKSHDLPRFVLRLNKGSVWVNAFDPIEILTPRSKAHFVHTVGAVFYLGTINKVLSAIGNIDMTFYDDTGGILTKFVVPLKNQIAFADSQLIKDYTRLEYSKLKKELKLGPVSSTILADEWVKNNISDDMNQLTADTSLINSFTDYNFRSNYHSISAQLALVPARKRIELLNLATVKLKYILGGVNLSNDNEQAKTILDEFNTLYEQLKGDPVLNDLIETQFYAIRNVRTDTPAYLVKEKLRQYLIGEYKSSDILRTYLADIDYLLRVGEIKQAESVAGEWLKQWNDSFRKNSREEFDQQARIYHSLILAYIGKITQPFLTILDNTGDYRLANSINPEETLYEIALERLEVSQYFVAVYRYTDAKTYLKTSYSELNLAQSETSAAAREVFIKEATLLADRITFAEQNLKGAASQIINESEFNKYLIAQERDIDLTEKFRKFIEETQKPAQSEVVYPTADEVSGLFAQNRITVLRDDIVQDEENKFEFDIKNGRFLDRSDDGSQIIFSGRLDYSNKALYNIILDSKPLTGSLTITDFIQVAMNGEKEITAVHVPVPDSSKISVYINSDDPLRPQVIAQDLAVSLMIKEFEQYNILIPTSQQVTILNTTTLTEFKVKDVYIEDTETKRKVMVSFNYNSDTKMISDISLKVGVELGLRPQIKISEFVSSVFVVLYGKEKEIEEAQHATEEIGGLNFILDASNVKFLDGGFTRVEFTDIKSKLMPIQISGIYNRETRKFEKAVHALLTSINVNPADYVQQLSKLWVIDYLGAKGIAINADNIVTQLPAEQVDIKNYTRGTKVINFTFDIKGNRLINILGQGLSTTIISMTFEEFSLIQGGTTSQSTATTPSQPKTSGINGTCADFADKLKDCIKYSCEFPDSKTGENMVRRITGSISDKCRYVEQMPDNQYMECNYDAGYRAAVAQQHADQLTLGNIITGSSFGAESSKFTYAINGVASANPAKDALASGQCVIGNQ